MEGRRQFKNSFYESTSGPFKLNRLPLFAYFKSLKWFPIPLSLGFALLSYQHYKRIIKRYTATTDENGISFRTIPEEAIENDLEIKYYRYLPLKSFSRAWGWINNVELPKWSRKPLLGLYANKFGCDLKEAENEDLSSYKNLGEFFRRELKQGARPIDNKSPIISPSDSVVLHFGKFENDLIEQVKGVNFSLKSFLGEPTWNKNYGGIKSDVEMNNSYSTHLLKDKNSSLFYCVLYLAPGDYHRFHSPVDWQVKFRRHFSGELLSVSPAIARWIGGLFNLNERVALIGEWKYGFFSMTAVGATNVGSINIYRDCDLKTNARRVKKNTILERNFIEPLNFSKGDPLGEFNLGSTIVLIFEAPNNAKLVFHQGDRVKVGEAILASN